MYLMSHKKIPAFGTSCHHNFETRFSLVCHLRVIISILSLAVRYHSMHIRQIFRPGYFVHWYSYIKREYGNSWSPPPVFFCSTSNEKKQWANWVVVRQHEQVIPGQITYIWSSWYLVYQGLAWLKLLECSSEP